MNIIRTATELAMHLTRPYIKSGAIVIDATCGNGHDTLALAKAMVEGSGLPASDNGKSRLLAFDIQQSAIDATERRLTDGGFTVVHPDCDGTSDNDSGNAPEIMLICDTHENMDRYTDMADVIVFNLGYRPGGDKSITTKAESTMNAINKALLLLRKDGLVCVTMYSGHAAGADEKKMILDFARGLDSSEFHSTYLNMINQENDPPEILLISRKKSVIHI